MYAFYTHYINVICRLDFSCIEVILFYYIINVINSYNGGIKFQKSEVTLHVKNTKLKQAL